MGGTGQGADDHAEAVIEGHRDADPVGLRIAEHRAAKVSIVEDVSMRQRGALWSAGRARRVLDVDRVVAVKLGLSLVEQGVGHAVALGQ